MPKAYWIARVDITDPDAYKEYLARNGVAFAKYGGRFIVRGGPFETVRGEARQRNIVIEFADLATAKACAESPEYAEAALWRDKGAIVDLILIEGYDGVQPGA